MADLTTSQRHVLTCLASTDKGGGFALACHGEDRAAAHALEKMGLAEWRGESFGSSFWSITDAGVALLRSA
jgi:hypothetical protein